MGLCQHGTELPESIQVRQCLDDPANFQGLFISFSDCNLSFTQFNPLHIQVILFIAFTFANHELTLASGKFNQTPVQVFNRSVGIITPSRPAILAAYFLNDTGTPIMSAHVCLWKCKLRAVFLAVKNLARLKSLDSVVSVVNRIQAGRPRNCDSNPGRSKRILLSPKGPDRLWGQNTLTVGTGSFFARCTVFDL